MLGCSVGEISRTGAPNRREVGHGEIIRNSTSFIDIPAEISIFVQNDVIACAGSSSMAGVIGTSICLYQASMTQHLIAGITVGTVDGRTLLLDIMEAED
jgi:polyribonucleotide nucleotidyltransferase